MSEKLEEKQFCVICGTKFSSELVVCEACGTPVMAAAMSVNPAGGTGESAVIKSGATAPPLRKGGASVVRNDSRPGSVYLAAIAGVMEAIVGLLPLLVGFLMASSPYDRGTGIFFLLLALTLIVAGSARCVGLLMGQGWGRAFGIVVQFVYLFMILIYDGMGSAKGFCLGILVIWGIFNWIVLNRPSLMYYLD